MLPLRNLQSREPRSEAFVKLRGHTVPCRKWPALPRAHFPISRKSSLSLPPRALPAISLPGPSDSVRSQGLHTLPYLVPCPADGCLLWVCPLRPQSLAGSCQPYRALWLLGKVLPKADDSSPCPTLTCSPLCSPLPLEPWGPTTWRWGGRCEPCPRESRGTDAHHRGCSQELGTLPR